MITLKLMPNTEPNVVQVAVGVIENTQGQLLITLRHTHLHQGGLWEFPGGKLEANETPEQALRRELQEELALTVLKAYPLITLKYAYSDLTVQLNVFKVSAFLGEVRSCEGQAFKWVAANDLKHYAFPQANQAIITAASLPPYYAILDDAQPEQLFSNFQILLKKDIKLIQARLKNVSTKEAHAFIKQIYPLCQQQRVRLLINSTVPSAEQLADGVHLTSRDLMTMQTRPKQITWLAASCHNLAELQQAERIGVDFVVLAPVLTTQTHPDTPALGWQQFTALVKHCNIPVYALGGLSQTDFTIAQQAGGQGIAAIRAFL